MIDDKDAVTVIVPYQVDVLIKELINADRDHDIFKAKSILKILNRHTIEVWQSQIDRHKSCFIDLFDGSIQVLKPEYYYTDRGFVQPQ